MSKIFYRNILVPYDNSKFSRKTLDIAMKFAQIFDSTLHIVTVVDMSYVNPPGLIKSKDEYKTLNQIRASIKNSAYDILVQKEMECSNIGIRTKKQILEGSVTEELVRVIKEMNIDLVIMGSQGLSGFSKIKSLGSVSRNISESVNCPVMIIH